VGLLETIWTDIIQPDVAIGESILRGTLLYLSVFIIMRTTLRRTAGELSMLDFIFVLLVANAAASAMTGGSVSVANGIILVITIVAWNYLINTATWYFPVLERWTAPPPIQLVRDGQMIRRNMRKEFITRDELMAQLREGGVEDISKVKSAMLEGDGNISIVHRDE
jgi:uncharacterized membrane protein YcaP (DUF421 family)